MGERAGNPPPSARELPRQSCSPIAPSSAMPCLTRRHTGPAAHQPPKSAPRADKSASPSNVPRAPPGSPASLHFFYIPGSSLFRPFTPDQLTFSTSKSATGDQNNGPVIYRRHHRLLGSVRGACHRLRQTASRPGRSPMTTWMLLLAGASTLLLFVYLVYALLRAEDLE
jgi:K+-transporting ATPase KdpF subunit